MSVTAESLIADTRQTMGLAIEVRDAKAVSACLKLLRQLGDERFTEQDDVAIKLLAEIDATPTALYRHYDKHDALLYVGVSMTITGRTAQHETYAPWFKQIDHINLDWYGSRSSALRAEQLAIKTEKPLYNSTFNKGNRHDLEKSTPRAGRPSHRKRQKPL